MTDKEIVNYHGLHRMNAITRGT